MTLPPGPPQLALGERPYRRLSPLTPLVRGFYLVVAFAATSWDDVLRGDVGPLGWLLLAVLLGGAVFGTASWLRTKYWIEGDELRVDTGLVSRQSRRIRVDRLQGIDIVQPFVARMFGLAELKMDVAGGSNEASLAYLPVSEARAVRALLLARREAARDVVDDAGPAPEQVIARLDPGMLVVSLLLAPETVVLVVGAVTFALVLGLLGSLGGVAGAVPVLLGFAVAQFRKLSAFYGFTVLETPAGLQVRRGLFEKSTQTLALPRLQGLVVAEPLMWRPLGWARLDVSVAGQDHGDHGGPAPSTVMPVAPRPLVLWLAARLLEGASGTGPVRLDLVPVAPAPARARWVAPVRSRYLAAGLGEHLVVGREGVLTRRTHVVPHARVQSLRLHQGPWQRRWGLADLLVDSPPGPVRLGARHRDVAEARRLLAEAGDLARAAR
ncbi:MAG: PH domain-containing protein [Nocardioidaceae bacterium]